MSLDFPCMVYRGSGEALEQRTVKDAAEMLQAAKEGWRDHPLEPETVVSKVGKALGLKK